MPPEPTFTDGERPTVRVERAFPHPIEKVWRAVTMPEHLGQWFPSEVELDLRPGGAMRFPDLEGDDAATGRVDEVDPPRRLSFTWGDDRLTFDLSPTAQGTAFVLSHTFDDRAGAASFAGGWEQCLAGLRSVLADEPLPPPDRSTARHEQLVERFELARPEITEVGGTWTVRVERQLTCPAGVAWDLWFGTDQQTGEQRRAPGVGEPLTPYMAPDLVVGTMSEVTEHEVLAFDVSEVGGPGDHVRLELRAGTGHGARAVLTVTGTDPAERDEAVGVWVEGAIGHLAASAAAWAEAQPAPAG